MSHIKNDFISYYSRGKKHYGNMDFWRELESLIERYREQLPPMRDLQCIIQPDPNVTWQVETGKDFYVFRDGRFQGVDYWGLMDWLIESGIVFFGRTISSAEYRKIFSDANEDASLGRKAGYLPGERKP